MPKQRFYPSDQAHPLHFSTPLTLHAMLEILLEKKLEFFKNDFLPLCDVPDVTPEKVGHNIRKCPDIITEKMILKTNISIANSLQTPAALNILPVPNVSADDINCHLNIDQTHLPKTVAPDPTDNVLKHNCFFCKKFLSNSSNGRPLLCCFDCQTSGSHRALVEIPVEVSPVSSVPMSMEMRKLADNNHETVEKLKALHSTENFCLIKPPICKYWLENPFQAHEVFIDVAKLPKRKAAGPSGFSFDLLKTAYKNTPEISEDLAIYFQNLMCLNYVPPPELTAARLVALMKLGKSNKSDGVRPIAIGESLTSLLSSLIFNRISTKARDYLKPS
ncbi:hypothetical protein P9112_010534 [Eukaryota sp. TZLM1-RC]